MQASTGKCNICSNNLSKAEMTKHLKSCTKKDASTMTSDNRKTLKTKVFHIVVEGRYMPFYWMHIEVPANATLQDLDSFLRRIWLECCGHLSAYTIEGKVYSSRPDEWSDDEDMNFFLGNTLRSKMRFYYEYDFGSTTNLTLKVVSEREGEITEKNAVRLLARNNPPLITCKSCEKSAAQVCTNCDWSMFCNECASKHGCGEEMLLPVVNSPRVGTCAYTG